MRHATLLLLIVLICCAIPAPAAHIPPRKPAIWARRATTFTRICHAGAYRECKPTTIPAPDGKGTVEVHYFKSGESLLASLTVKAPGGKARTTKIEGEDWGDVELLWASDSKAFFVNGAAGGYYGGWVYVYILEDQDLEPRPFNDAVQRDMVVQFPPCKADGHEDFCADIEKNPSSISVNGIAWVKGSSALIVMAEIPCSGTYGGIMCQVLGYELAVPSGEILRRIDAKHFKAEWQTSMAFKFRVPEPPEYE